MVLQDTRIIPGTWRESDFQIYNNYLRETIPETIVALRTTDIKNKIMSKEAPSLTYSREYFLMTQALRRQREEEKKKKHD